jgi:tRNA1(Val) A37 N6-methylase TrmN6
MKRDYSKFFTPNSIAMFMASLLSPKDDQVILEPSAGHGALIRAVKYNNPSCKVFAFDINEVFKPYMRNAGASIAVIKDFLTIPVYAKFSGCIANPPFGNETNLQAHFDHIRSHVKKAGKIVMIAPADFDPGIEHNSHSIENWAKNSDGTTTPIKVIEFIN